MGLMTTFVSLLFLLLPSLYHAKPLDSCSLQKDCIRWTFMELSEDPSMCNQQTGAMVSTGSSMMSMDNMSSSCVWQVCLVLDTENENCMKKGGKFSHTCHKSDTCGGDGMWSKDNSDVGPYFEQCQVGLSGSTVSFIVKEGSKCSDSVNVTIDTIDAGVACSATTSKTCTGNGNIGKECQWDVTLPTVCGNVSSCDLPEESDCVNGCFNGTCYCSDCSFGATLDVIMTYFANKYGQFDFTLTGIISLTAEFLLQLAASITKNEIVVNTNAVFGFCLATPQLVLPVIPFSGSIYQLTSITVTFWGSTTTKAIFFSYPCTLAGFATLNITGFSSAIQYITLFNVERFNNLGIFTNDQDFEFDVDIPQLLSGLVVFSHRKEKREGVDCRSEGGRVEHMGKGKWRIRVKHTSALSLRVAPETKPSSGSNSGLYALFAIFAIIPVALLICWGAWYMSHRSPEPAPQYGHYVPQAANSGAFYVPPPTPASYVTYA